MTAAKKTSFWKYYNSDIWAAESRRREIKIFAFWRFLEIFRLTSLIAKKCDLLLNRVVYKTPALKAKKVNEKQLHKAQ